MLTNQRVVIAMSDSDFDRADDTCYWCGGEPADGGTIKIQMREGEPKRETCPSCFRNWPPEEVKEEYMDGEQP
jgi:hypothetical protein